MSDAPRLPLTEALLAALRPRDGGAAPALPSDEAAALEALLEARARQAAERFPEVRLPAEAFVQALAARCQHESAQGRLHDRITALHTDDVFLAHACLRGDPGALRRFETELLLPAVHAAVRPDEPALRDEVAQALRMRLLCPADADKRPGRLAEYGGRGPLLGWLRVSARRDVVSLLRAARPQPLADSDVELVSGQDLELDLIKSRYRDAFNASLRAAMDSLGAAERTLLRLHYSDGLSIDKLAALYRIGRSTAARRIIAAREQLVVQMRAHLAQRMELQSAEFDSLIGVLVSRLSLSLHGSRGTG